MAKQWDALVLNDYEAVMPLTWNKKYGIAYLYQPFLTAQLGVFGKNISGELLEAFLTGYSSKIPLLGFLPESPECFHVKKFSLYQRKNYILDLDKPYEEL